MREKLKSMTAVFYTPLLIYFVFFVIISLVSIASATPVARIQYPDGNFVSRQVIFFAIGGAVAFIVMLFEIKWARFLRWPAYIILLGLLIFIWFEGESYPCLSEGFVPCLNGATRWLNFPLFQVQPSEFMRIALILVIADVIQRHNEKFLHATRTFKSDFWLIVKCLVVIGPPLYFIYDQPDTGISILILVATAFMLMTAGIKWTYIIVVGALAAVVSVTFIHLVLHAPEVLTDNFDFHAHQFSRIYGWQDPFSLFAEEGHQLGNGLIAMGRGGLWGNGFSSASHFFPEAHTDFIFAVIGMDFGLIGTGFVIILSMMFNFAVLNTAILNRDHYNNHVCVGIFASLMAQQFWNIAMTVGILPITGVTLPFISHGGSSVLASMIMLGLVLSSQVEGLTIKRNTTIYREDISYLEEKELII